jgi:hypothetical protein
MMMMTTMTRESLGGIGGHAVLDACLMDTARDRLDPHKRRTKTRTSGHQSTTINAN